MPHSPFLLFLLFLLRPYSLFVAQQLPNPDPQTIHPNQQTTFHTNPSSFSSPPITIPSFPEQSAVAGCPISLPNELFPSVKSSCLGHHHRDHNGNIQYGSLHRSRCCPVLAAWLYSSYSATALGRRSSRRPSIKTSTGSTTTFNTNKSSTPAAPNSYEMPMLPDDSEGCVDGLETAMRANGVNLGRPNASCDVVYCYCGIRLHQLSCPASFRPSTQNGDLTGDQKVERLEKDCLPSLVSSRGAEKGNGISGVAGCSKCLNSLYKLSRGSSSRSGNHSSQSVEEVRTSKMRSRECELMGLTWLLDKNRTAYLHTVTLVLRSLMVNDKDLDNEQGSSARPVSCGLGRDGMPLAVTSTEISGTPAFCSPIVSGSLIVCLVVLCMSTTLSWPLYVWV